MESPPRLTVRRIAALLIGAPLFVGAMLWGVLAAGPAGAHATVVASTPGDGNRLDAAPSSIAIDLDEPVTLVPDSPGLLDSAGTRHRFGEARLDNGGRRVTLVPAETLPDEAYLATARVVSADNHVVSLSVRFTVGDVTAVAPTAQTDDGGSASTGVIGSLAKIAVYTGTVLSAGILLAGRWVWPGASSQSRFQVLYRWGIGVLVVGSVGRLALLAVDRGGLIDVLASRTGAAIVAASVLGVAAAVRLGTLAYAAAAAAILAVTLGGHGGSVERWPWAFVETAIHVYAMSVWFGGVALLVAVLRPVTDIRRWHAVAAGHLAAVVITGVGLGLLQVYPAGALATTGYGRTLVIKAVAVAFAAALGWWAHRRYRESSTTEEVRPRQLFVEVGVAAVIVGLASVLSSTTPARDTYTTDVTARLAFTADQVYDVAIDSVRRGDQVLTLTADDAVGSPEVSVELSSVEANVARLPVAVTADRSGDEIVWRSEGLIVPAVGTWKVTVRVDDGISPRLASFSSDVL